MDSYSTGNDGREDYLRDSYPHQEPVRRPTAVAPGQTTSHAPGSDPVPDGITRYRTELKSGQSSYTYRPPLWRQEVARRVNAHRARRQNRAAQEESLPLDFATETAAAELGPAPQTDRPQRNRWRMDLAARGIPAAPVEPLATSAQTPDSHLSTRQEAILSPDDPDLRDEVFSRGPDGYASRGSSALKLLSFPRADNSPSPMPETEQLADPVVSTRPRILDAPDEIRQAVVPSTLFDVRLESDDDDLLAAPDFQLPLQVASLSRRVCSAAVDGLVVLVATAIFATVIHVIIGATPPGRSFWMLALALPALLWSLYQYLFLAYAGCTPGMQMAQLEVTTFEGENPSLRRCRGRAIAAAASCLSMGMGFLWALMDDDHLGWHDRITRTYLRRF